MIIIFYIFPAVYMNVILVLLHTYVGIMNIGTPPTRLEQRIVASYGHEGHNFWPCEKKAFRIYKRVIIKYCTVVDSSFFYGYMPFGCNLWYKTCHFLHDEKVGDAPRPSHYVSILYWVCILL